MDVFENRRNIYLKEIMENDDVSETPSLSAIRQIKSEIGQKSIVGDQNNTVKILAESFRTNIKGKAFDGYIQVSIYLDLN